MKNNAMKVIIEAIMGVAIQPILILPRIAKFTFLPPLINPMPSTAPTTAWELDTGTKGIGGIPALINNCCNPCEAKMKRTIELDITTTRAVIGERA